MARRQQSVAEDLIELTSRFPWWAGVLLAAGSYVWLHSIASKGIPHASGGELALAIRGGMFYRFASLGQYVLPFVFGSGTLLSLVMSAKRKVTKNAVAFARENNIELLDGKHLRRILKPSQEISQEISSSTKYSKPTDFNPDLGKENRTCQKCGSPMVVRVAKKGSRAGQEFWGCSKFPSYRFTMPID